MKKIGKNTKLYLIGMIIGGITLGITTVIADTIINSTSVAYKTTTVKAALDELYDIADFKQEVKDMLYPVGSIYISVSSTNPSQLFGGTWVLFGPGRTLLGTGSVEANNNTFWGDIEENSWGIQRVEEKGGSYTHSHGAYDQKNGSLSVPIGHRNGDPNSLIFSIPDGYSHGTNSSRFTLPEYWKVQALRTANTDGRTLHAFLPVYGATSEKVTLPPYISVYMWKRTS